MKILSLFTLLLSLPHIIVADNELVLQWQKRLANEVGNSYLQLHDAINTGSSLILAGSASDQFGSYMYLANFDYNGNKLSDTLLTTGGNSAIKQLIKDDLGHIYAIGTESISPNRSGIHLVKLNNNFELIENQPYTPIGQNSFIFGEGVIWQNNLVICGYKIDSDFFESSFITRFSNNLDIIWEREYNQGFVNSATDIDVDNQGNFTVVGSANDDFSFFAIHYDESGNFLWQYPQSVSIDNFKGLSDVKCSDDGFIYAVGSQESQDELFVYEIVTLKLSNVGELIWQQNYTNQTECFGSFLEIDNNENVCVAGNTTDFTVVIQYNSLGQQQWITAAAPDLFPYSTALKLDESGTIFICASAIDSTGIYAINQDGQIVSELVYPVSTIESINNLVFENSLIFIAGTASEGLNGVLASLENSTLNQVFLESPQGNGLSDVQPGGISISSNNIFVSSVTETSDSLLFNVTKTDLNGNVIWEKSISLAGLIPGFNFIKTDLNNNVIGYYHSASNVDGGNVYLVKYDSDGNLIFNNLLNSSGLCLTGGLDIDQEGNIYIAGVNNTVRNMFVRKYSAEGIQQWETIYQSPASTIPVCKPYKLELSNQNKIVIAASHRGENNDNNFHIFQLDSQGNIEWNQDVADQSGNSNEFYDLIIQSDGKILALGASAIVQTAATMFDANGQTIWTLSEPNAFSARPQNAAIDEDGNTYIFYSKNGSFTIRKISPTGNLILEQEISFNTSGTFYFPLECEVFNNQLIVLGEHTILQENYSFGVILSDNLQVQSHFVDSLHPVSFSKAQLSDAGSFFAIYLETNNSNFTPANATLLRRYDIGTVGIGSHLIKENNLLVFPNPSNGFITVRSNSLIEKCSVFDFSGKLILEINPSLSLNSVEIITKSFDKGLYFLLTETRGTLYSSRFIVN